MNQLQLCAKLYAIAGIDQAPECIESATKLIFLSGHAIAAYGAITGSSPFQAGHAYDSHGMTPGVPLDSPLLIKSITRIQYSDFRSIPLNIGGRYREES